MPSRKLEDLDPRMIPLVDKFIHECAFCSIDLLVTCTYRDNTEQAHLYSQGRSRPGSIVTNAKPGQSKHNARNALLQPASLAVDVVPLRLGKPIWDAKDPVWQTVGEIGEAAGLAWAGRWTRFKEFPHFELKE